MNIIPGEKTQKTLFSSDKILVAKVLGKYLDAFKVFNKNVCWHIPHVYSKEMAEKSEVVSFISFSI